MAAGNDLMVDFYPRYAGLAARGSGQAKLWCFENFARSGTPEASMYAGRMRLALDLIDNFADENWSDDLVYPLMYSEHDFGLDTADALLRHLGATSSRSITQEKALYARAKEKSGTQD